MVRDMVTKLSKQTPEKPDLTILIPALGEEKRIGATLDELAAFLKHDPFFKTKDIELIVVSADAPDRTHEIVESKSALFKKYHFQFLKPGPKLGKGRDVQYGMLRARGKIVIYMDADLATPLHHLEKFYKACERGSDVVIGTRNLLKHHPSVFRRMISNGGNMLFRIVGGVWVEDSQCGFKMFNERACHICFSKMTIQKWGFDMEILAIAKANGMKITCFRIKDWRSVPDSTFTENIIKNSLRSLRDLACIALNRIRGAYISL